MFNNVFLTLFNLTSNFLQRLTIYLTITRSLINSQRSSSTPRAMSYALGFHTWHNIRKKYHQLVHCYYSVYLQNLNALYRFLSFMWNALDLFWMHSDFIRRDNSSSVRLSTCISHGFKIYVKCSLIKLECVWTVSKELILQVYVLSKFNCISNCFKINLKRSWWSLSSFHMDHNDMRNITIFELFWHSWWRQVHVNEK